MIVVIADDLTGAAEIGGIGLRFGLKVLLSADVCSASVDLLVFYTNTRSLPEAEAVELMQVMTKKVVKLQPTLFYKKTDSVLRGHVLAEMKAQMEALSLNRALLVPVNPLLGRTIQNGTYYVNGRPVHEAGFASDPEFPISDSNVESMLGAVDGEVQLRSFSNQLPEGITVGEASTMKDVKEWVAVSDRNILFAGAASFFAALLHQQFVEKRADTKPMLSSPLLLVSGTTYQPSLKKQLNFQRHVCPMSAELFNKNSRDPNGIQIWAEGVVNHLRENGRCIMTVGPQEGAKADSGVLQKTISAAVKQVIERFPIKELFIEGGATSFSIIQELGLMAFAPTEELQQGVVRMKVVEKDDLYLTIKPGSYAWPQAWEEAFS